MRKFMVVVLLLTLSGCGKGKQLYAACKKQSTDLVASASHAADP